VLLNNTSNSTNKAFVFENPPLLHRTPSSLLTTKSKDYQHKEHFLQNIFLKQKKKSVLISHHEGKKCPHLCVLPRAKKRTKHIEHLLTCLPQGTPSSLLAPKSQETTPRTPSLLLTTKGNNTKNTFCLKFFFPSLIVHNKVQKIPFCLLATKSKATTTQRTP